jgi:hypothetical protein
MGKGSGSVGAKRRCKKKKTGKRENGRPPETSSQPQISVRRLDTATRCALNTNDEFLPLKQVEGLHPEARKFLEEHAFNAARFNREFKVFEATNKSGKMIIRGGLSPYEWQKVSH